jgi:hypothetical protein
MEASLTPSASPTCFGDSCSRTRSRALPRWRTERVQINPTKQKESFRSGRVWAIVEYPATPFSDVGDSDPDRGHCPDSDRGHCPSSRSGIGLTGHEGVTDPPGRPSDACGQRRRRSRREACLSAPMAQPESRGAQSKACRRTPALGAVSGSLSDLGPGLPGCRAGVHARSRRTDPEKTVKTALADSRERAIL